MIAFIELTVESDGKSILINVNDISTMYPGYDHKGTVIYLTGDGELPARVRESYDSIRRRLFDYSPDIKVL